jgi:hypothetical protein
VAEIPPEVIKRFVLEVMKIERATARNSGTSRLTGGAIFESSWTNLQLRNSTVKIERVTLNNFMASRRLSSRSIPKGT